MNKHQNIPTNIISGFLGAGKTTAIKHLLKQKPDNERWAIIVNEFGQVGIDDVLLDNDAVKIKQIPGGCLCCVGSQSFSVGLNEVIRSINPHRIIIEPTGLGHPEKLIASLCGEYYQSVLTLKAVITLVDARQLSQSRYMEHETFRSQLKVADILIANKSDTYTDEDKQNFSDFVDSCVPNKSQVEILSQAKLNLQWLDVKHVSLLDIITSHQQDIHRHDHAINQNSKWHIHQASADGFSSVGWVLDSEYVFDKAKLLAWLSEMSVVERIKGVMNTEQGWISINYSHADRQILNVSKKDKAKLEIITALREGFEGVSATQLNNRLESLLRM